MVPAQAACTIPIVRPILRGRVYLITRRCAQRQFLLRPDDKTNQAFLYCLGGAAKRFGIEPIAWLAMSNHYHALVHDLSEHAPIPAADHQPVAVSARRSVLSVGRAKRQFVRAEVEATWFA